MKNMAKKKSKLSKDSRFYQEIENRNDTYGLKEQLALIIEELEDLYYTDLTKFLSYRKTKAAGTRSRTRIRNIRAALHELSADILKKRQDYDSDYE
jgi:hypothetical protein